MDLLSYTLKARNGRLLVVRSFDDVPVKTEIEKVDGELLFFFPDGSVYVCIETADGDSYNRLVEISVH